MKVTTSHELQITPPALARALFDAEPGEFARVWLEFAQLAKARDGAQRLDAFAQAMAPQHGGLCKAPLRDLVRLIDFHEIAATREPASDADQEGVAPARSRTTNPRA